MFGFGRSSKETAVINLFAISLQEIEMSEKEAREVATKLVDEVLPEIRSRGIDPFKMTQGDEYVQRVQFTEPRLASGVTLDDIRTHWNRPLLVVLGEVKLRELINFMVVDVARRQGKDVSDASRKYKINFPRYGDPRQWNPDEPFNRGLAEKDADLFVEIAGRVDRWRQRVGDEYVGRAVTEHGTLNAAIRYELARGTL